MGNYKIRVTKDYLSFCSGHFIIFDGNRCEHLHGHNYKVAAEIEGPLDDDYLIFDFILLKHTLRDLVNELDHRMLVPTKCKRLQLEVSDTAVEMSHERDGTRKEWKLPREDCVLLPIENTTAELLASWLAGRLLDELARIATERTGRAYVPPLLRLEVEEAPGQAATYEVTAAS